VKRVAIVGATGYSGGELTALLARHPNATLAALYHSGESHGGSVPFRRLHPALANAAGPDAVAFNVEDAIAGGADCVFLATPNEVSAALAPKLVDAGMRVVDLSGAFRLRRPSAYAEWYGFTHPRPDLLSSAVYGLTEWCNGELATARLVANPGCYPTAILLALRPLAHSLDRSQAIVCDAKSGVSGAGKKSDVAFSFAELSGNFKAYSVSKHRHTPEIRDGLPIPHSTEIVFVPHLLPTVRGILATIHVALARPHTPGEVAQLYASHYASAPFVRILPPGELPELGAVVGSPRADIGFTLLDRGRRAVVVSVIDNLLKGAASQAVQNFNRMFGFDEREGLA
jgi:N-acetyl-gamma-glutamyl-phosphate reductase